MEASHLQRQFNLRNGRSCEMKGSREQKSADEIQAPFQSHCRSRGTQTCIERKIKERLDRRETGYSRSSIGRIQALIAPQKLINSALMEPERACEIAQTGFAERQDIFPHSGRIAG